MTKLLRKMIVLFVVLAFVCGTLVGCSGSGTPADQGGEVNTEITKNETESTHGEEIPTDDEGESTSDQDMTSPESGSAVNDGEAEETTTEASGEDLTEEESTEEESTHGEDNSTSSQDRTQEDTAGLSTEETEKNSSEVTTAAPPAQETTTPPTEESTEEKTQAVTLTSLTVKTKASAYKSGYQLTKSDIIVTAAYSDGSSETLASGYSIKQSGASLYVTYNGVKSNTIAITYRAEATTETPTEESTETTEESTENENNVISVSVRLRGGEYREGYCLTKDDLSVTAKMFSGSRVTVSDYTIYQSGASLYVVYNNVKSNTLTITFIEETTAAPVTLSSVSVKANAAEYAYGYQLTKSDLTVTAAYSDGSVKIITDYSITQSGTSLYVSYDGLTSNTIAISYRVVLSSITLAAKVSEYDDGYQLTKSDLTVTATYSDGSTKTITDYSITQSGTSLYVSYDGMKSNTITITYKVVDTTPVVVSVSAALKKDFYLIGDVITVNDFVVTATYSDGISVVVTDGLIMYDCSGANSGTQVSSITLTEYSGEAYVKNSYYASFSYEGVISVEVHIPCNYPEGVWLCQEMLSLVNAARVEAGLSELHWDSAAEGAILTRAEELAVSYSHTRPNGEEISSLYADYRKENISKGSYRSASAVQTTFESWMNSAGHKACILHTSSLVTGFVCAYIIDTDVNGNQISYWVMWVTMN